MSREREKRRGIESYVRRRYYPQAVVLLCGGVISATNAWRTSARVNKAIEVLENQEESCLLITSGVSGHKQFAERPESHLYLDYLQEKFPSVDRRRIFIEDLSRDTVGNVYFSMNILRLLVAGSSRVTWVTNAFHADRLEAIIQWLDKDRKYDHRVESVCDSEGGQMMKLLADERESKRRFQSDIKSALSGEALLFLKHDFYRIDRLMRID